MNKKFEEIEKRYEELEQLMSSHEVIADRQSYNLYAKELSLLSPIVYLFREYKKRKKEISKLINLLREKHEPEFLSLINSEIEDLEKKNQHCLSKLNDSLQEKEKEKIEKNIIIEIRAGTGGDEAGLFSADLYRMYTKYALKKSWAVEILSSHPTELGGFKEIIFSVRGRGVYDRLKWESGVHRVQRIPQTETGGRIHTSTATVVVLEEPKEIELEIKPDDLKIDVFRSRGHGGQSVNTTDSAVRITHLFSGIVVTCQDERSQLKNKNKALRVLRARLLQKEKEKTARLRSSERKTQVGSGERSEKIRTYNFPGQRVTDHRIGLTLHKLEAILDGDLDRISDALLKGIEG
ncbi:MAG: peptide chain release factor 1 [Candidatus Omnitrophica bacterium]|nr:peptide chain release factor 1 [Candidatus Omnitrophota bacterium]